jgi:large subunit ribosomal protein L17
MFSNMVASLVQHERVETTFAKAKELRRLAERTITKAVQVADLDEKNLSADDKARLIHAMRMAKRVVRDEQALYKLFHELGGRFKGRPGGYTRLLHVGHRKGDAAPLSMVELLPAEAKEPEKPAKGGGKRKAAATK